MRHLPLCVISVLLPTLTIAAQSPASQPAALPAPLPAQGALRTHNFSVQEVLTLKQANVGDPVIMAKLTQANHAMDLSVDDLLRLKQAGVSDAVVRTMIAPGGTSALPALPPGTAPLVMQNVTQERLRGLNPTGATAAYGSDTSTSIDNPLAPHDSGVYLATSVAGGGERLHFMDRAVISGTSEDNLGLAMLTFTAVPLVFRYQIPHGRAQTRTSDTLPVFYFYFEDKAAALGKSAFSAADVSAPTQFTRCI